MPKYANTGPLEFLLTRRGYEMEVEQEPDYFPPFVWIYARQGEKRIPICATTSYFLSDRGLDSLPNLVERILRETTQEKTMSLEDETAEFFGVVQAQQDRIAELEQLAKDAAKLLEDISHPFRPVGRYDVEQWQERCKRLLGEKR